MSLVWSAPVHHLLGELARSPRQLATYAVLVLGEAGLTSLRFLLLAQLVQAGLAGETGMAALLLAATLAAWLLSQGAGYLGSLCGLRFERGIGVRHVQAALARMLDAHQDRIDQMDPNHAVHLLRTGLTISARTMRALLTMLTQSVLLLFTIGTAFYLNPALAAVSLAAAATTAVATARHVKRQREGVNAGQMAQRNLHARLCRLFAALPQVKLYGAGDEQVRRLIVPLERQIGGEQTALLGQRRTSLEIHLASALTALVILALGAVLIHQGWTTIAEATTILVLNQSIFTGVRQIVLQWGHAEENSDLLAMLLTGESEDSAATSPSGRPITEPIQSIECIDAAFAVQELVLLQKVTCRLEAGRLYGVSGASGSGKTMLLHLLAGTAHAASGRVLVNGNDTQELDLHSFRRRVALVTWPPLLVEGGTIAENLRLARRDATDDDLRECLRLAAMETDLVRLESVGGLAAKLGRAGVQLSVGQMQRLAIARALLRKPDVLLIDDLLTGLDPETCGQVMQSLRSYARSHLVVIVAPHERIAEMCDELLITRAGSLAA